MSDAALAVDAWESLFRTQVVVMRQLTAEFPSGEVTMGDYDALFTLSRAENRRLRIKTLAENMLLTQPSVSRLIERLATRGLVNKLSDPEDGRGVIVELTPHGYDVFRRAAVRHMEGIVSRLTSALSADELRQLTELTTKLRASVSGHASPDAAD